MLRSSARRAKCLASKLSYSNVVSSLALFVALGGVSYAAIKIPAHSVGARQLKSQAVTQGKLAFPLSSDAATQEAQVSPQTCPPNAPCPIPLEQPIASVKVSLKQAADLVITPSVTTGSSEAAVLRLRVIVDDRAETSFGTAESLSGGAHTISFQGIATRIPAGEHTVSLLAGASSAGGQRLTVASRLNVVAMPAS